MAQATVPGTKIRGRVYYLNIAIPPPIRHLYGGRERLTDTLKTADPKVAANGVIVARAEFIRQVEEVSRAADINARLAELPADQRELYDRAGGLEGLLAAFQRTRTAQAFMLAGDPTDGPETDLPDPDALETEFVAAEHRAASAALEGIARREAKALRALPRPWRGPHNAPCARTDDPMTYVSPPTPGHPCGMHHTAHAMEEEAKLATLFENGVAVITIITDQGTKWRVDPKRTDPRPLPAPEWTDTDGHLDLDGGLAEW